MVYNGYYKVMSNIPQMGHLPTPVQSIETNQPISARLRIIRHLGGRDQTEVHTAVVHTFGAGLVVLARRDCMMGWWVTDGHSAFIELTLINYR